MTTAQLLILLDFLSELLDQVSYNASADDLQSFPTRTRQIKRADDLRTKIAAFRERAAQKPEARSQKSERSASDF